MATLVKAAASLGGFYRSLGALPFILEADLHTYSVGEHLMKEWCSICCACQENMLLVMKVSKQTT